MDTETGQIIQVVETAEHAKDCGCQDHQHGLVNTIMMTRDQVDAMNVQRKAEGKGQIEPIKQPKANCRRCHGRGHLGKDLKSQRFIKCPCVYTDEEAKIRRANIAKNELEHQMHARK